MASSTDESEDDSFVVLGTQVPDLTEGQAQKKPTTIHDLTARDKQGRRRFHGAFTGGFSAGYFNTVGTKEGFTPSTFISSRSQKNEKSEENRPEDFMDEEDLEEHGIAPRKFATVGSYTSEERKRKLSEDSKRLTTSSHINLVPSFTDLIIPEQLPIGIKILRKMGWREGQGLGPRLKKKKKSKRKSKGNTSESKAKVYGCALPPSDQGESDSDDFVPENMSTITFAPKDVSPISLEAKNNVHGLGYRGIDPSLALPSSHISLFEPKPVHLRRGGKGIQGQAFGVGVFEEEDADIYAVDNMSNYDITMQLDNDESDGKFGWTAPRNHGKQVVPVSYVGKLLEGFTLSSQSLKPKKGIVPGDWEDAKVTSLFKKGKKSDPANYRPKYPPPVLPRDFKPQHWFRKRREASHLPASLTGDDHRTNQREKITAIDRGLMLGETPIMDSVFDLVPKEDKNRIEATKQAIAITKSLTSRASADLASRFQPVRDDPAEEAAGLSSGPSGSHGTTSTYLSKFKPADVTFVKSMQDVDVATKFTAQSDKTPLFQGSLSFQPFRKDPAKQVRYDTYLTSMKQGATDPYSTVESRHMTEWEKARERDEFSKAATIYRPMSALMSSRFVRGAMIDDDKTELPLDTEREKSDQAKAAEMKMFGKLTREEFEWHPDKLLCRRFNVPNPYPGSDLVGLPTVKRDKYSVFNFLNFGDHQSGDMQEPPVIKSETPAPEPGEKTLKSAQSRRATMASIFKVLDDPDFHKPVHQSVKETAVSSVTGEMEVTGGQVDNSDTEPDKDLFRAIFKNSDSESSNDESEDEKKYDAASNEEDHRSDSVGSDSSQSKRIIKGDEQANLNKSTSEKDRPVTDITEFIKKEDLPSTNLMTSTTVPDSKVKSWRPRSRWGEKSVFCVLNDLEKGEASTNNKQLPDDTSRTETGMPIPTSPPHISGTDEDGGGGEYVVRLPPASTSFTDSNKHTSETEKVYKTDNSRDREHRHKKDKKKKSKHKKGKKHKKHRKSRKSKKDNNSSGSEADTETSDASDSELLERLKQASHSGTLLQVLKKL